MKLLPRGMSSIVALVSLVASARAQVPLPVDGNVTLKTAGLEFTVEGRVHLDRRFDFASQRAITIRGVGGDATLVVSGSFELKAVTGGNNVIENLTLELADDCRSVYLSNVIWSGGGGVRTAEGKPTSAKVFCEFLQMRSTFNVEAYGGAFALQASLFTPPVRIHGLAPTESKANTTTLLILACKSGLTGGLEVRGVAEATIRHNKLAGDRVLLENIGKLDLDGNLVTTDLLDLRVAHYTGFKKTKVRNCDFAGPRVRLFAPAEEDKRLKVTFQNCWFRSSTDPEIILAQTVRDATHDAECGILAAFQRISAAPLELGGPLNP